MFCSAEKEVLVACPYCLQRHCARCYIIHERDKALRLAKDLGDTEAAIRRAKELKDTEGTSTPAATTPKVYRGGGGSPDEPPEGAGAPNRPRKEVRRKG